MADNWLAALLGGGGFQAVPPGGILAGMGQDEGGYQGFMNSLNNNRNMIAGLGLGLMSGTKYNPYGNVMQGFTQGAGLDALNSYRQGQLRQRAEDMAFRRQEAGRAQSNADRAYQFQVQQANKPQIHWPKEYEDEDGNRVQPPPVLVHPDGKITPVDPKMMPQVAPPASAPGPQTNAAPFTPPGEEDASLPTNAQLAQAGGPEIVNPGAKFRGPQKYREEAQKKQADADVKNREASKTAEQIDSLITGLYEKTKDPLFKEAAGPMHESIRSSPLGMSDPRRLAYEYTPLGPSDKAKDFYGQIQADTQAINSQLQRALLSGMGSAANWERAEVNKILGQIPAARSPEEAQHLLNNARSLIRTMFQRGGGYNVPTGGGDAAPTDNGWTIKRVD